MRNPFPEPEYRVLNYPLKAWIDGHYARDGHKPVTSCPYGDDTIMGKAWLAGWQVRDKVNAPATDGGRQA
jgi:hypothetical protein